MTYVAAVLNRTPSVNLSHYNLNFLISTILSLKEHVTDQNNLIIQVMEKLGSIHRELKSVKSRLKSSQLNSTPGHNRKRNLSPATAITLTPSQKQCRVLEGNLPVVEVSSGAPLEMLFSQPSTTTASESCVISASLDPTPAEAGGGKKMFAKTIALSAGTKQPWNL